MMTGLSSVFDVQYYDISHPNSSVIDKHELYKGAGLRLSHIHTGNTFKIQLPFL